MYPKGYLVRVVSWENDGDHYNTSELSVPDLEDATVINEFAKLIGGGDLGNKYEPCDSEMQEISDALVLFAQQTLVKHPEFRAPNRKKLSDMTTEIEIVDYLMDLAGILGLTDGEFHTRVCESVEVFYFAEDDVCEQVEF